MEKSLKSPSLEKKPILRDRYGSVINGVEIFSEKLYDNYDPHTGKVICKISSADKALVNKAIKSAEKAFQSWSKLSSNDRALHLFNIARKIQEFSKELAILESYDSGKPIRNCRDFDIVQAYETFFFHAGNANAIEKLFPATEPYGVVGQVIPWNFPFMMLAWKLAPALAAGNTVVIKPAPNTSLTALRFMELVKEAGLPDGVVNVIVGDGEVGSDLLSHKEVTKVAFTGSTKVGKEIYRNALVRGVPATVELGGKSANIIFEDASINEAVEGIISAIFYNSGQVCSAGSRLLLHESIEEEVINKLRIRMDKIVVGNPLDKNTEYGPLASKEQYEKVSKYLTLAQNEYSNLEISTKIADEIKDAKLGGYYIPPAFVKVDNMADKLSLEEIFGPLLVYSTFTTPKEAIAKANNHFYGLAAGIWSSDLSFALKVAEKIEAGTIWINSYNQFSPKAPFGGFKESGIGRENGFLVIGNYRKRVKS